MLPNFSELFSKLQEMQGKMTQLKDALAHESVTAQAGGGMVTVVMNGNRELTSVTIEPALLKESEAELVQDLIVAAVNQAAVEMEALVQQRTKEMARNMMPGGLGGIDFSRFGL